MDEDGRQSAEPVVAELVTEPKSGPRPIEAANKITDLSEAQKDAIYTTVTDAGGIMLTPIGFMPEHIASIQDMSDSWLVTGHIPARGPILLNENNDPADETLERLHRHYMFLKMTEKTFLNGGFTYKFIKGVDEASNRIVGFELKFKISKENLSLESAPF